MEDLRHSLIELVDESLSYTLLIRGERRKILTALRAFLQVMPPESLKLFQSCYESLTQGESAMTETQMKSEHPELSAQADAVGAGGPILLWLITTFGPVLAKIILDLLTKKKEQEAKGMTAPGDAQAFKTKLLKVIEMAEAGATMTPTPWDDTGVKLLKEMVANTSVVELLFQLFGK